MTSTSIKKFIKLRKQLESERTKIAARLQEVEAALGSFQSSSPTPKTAAKKRGPKPGSKRKVSNEVSLKDSILKVVGKQQMTKEQILEGVIKSGYRFRTSNPANSLNVVLYGKKPKFSRKDGKFGVV
jgi:hypothetical protein